MKYKHVSFLILAGIVLLAVLVRRDTVWLPHFRGDEGHYISLAMKLDQGGLPFYNLRGIEVAGIADAQLKVTGVELGYPVYVSMGDGKGTMLRVLESIGLAYYDIPFLHTPPLFAYTLRLSHMLFLGKSKPYFIVVADPHHILYSKRPPPMRTFQLYAVIVPLLFSVGLIISTYLLGRYLFNYSVGLIAALFVAVNPVDIMTAQKLWADDQTAFFFVCAFTLFIIGMKRSSYAMAILSGILCGLAFLSKNTGGFLVPLVWGISFLRDPRGKWDARTITARVFNPYFLAFTAGFFIITWWWFYKMYAFYGAPQHWPLFLSQFHEAVKRDVTGFYINLAKRPSAFILYPVTSVAMCPVLIFAVLTLKAAAENIVRFFSRQKADAKLAWLWAVVVIFCALLTAISGKEDRYFLPAYPFLSIAAAIGVQSMRLFITRYARAKGVAAARILGNSIIGIVIIASSAWSIHLGIMRTVSGALSIQFPF